MKWIAALFLLPFSLIIGAPMNEDFEQCLSNLYELPESTRNEINARLESVISKEEFNLLVPLFIKQTEDLIDLHAYPSVAPLSENDAMAIAPDTHDLIFENSRFRVLWIHVDPMQRVPFHSHQHDGIVLTLTKARFATYLSEDTFSEDDWEPDTEVVMGGDHLHSFLNLGTGVFSGLLFEIK